MQQSTFAALLLQLGQQTDGGVLREDLRGCTGQVDGILGWEVGSQPTFLSDTEQPLTLLIFLQPKNLQNF